MKPILLLILVAVTAALLGWLARSRISLNPEQELNMNRFLSLVAQLAPIIAVAAGLPPQVGSVMATGIIEAASIKGSGAEKNAHVVNLVNASLAATSAIGDATNHPEIPKVISTIVDTAKAIDAKHP